MGLFNRLEFELAEPGTDPTRQRNPYPKKRGFGSSGEALAWVGILVAFVAFGYFYVFKPDKPASANKPQPTATEAQAKANSIMGDMNILGTGKGEPTVDVTPTLTLTPTPTFTPTPLPTPTLTPTPPGFGYSIFLDGEQIDCWCNPDTNEVIYPKDVPACRDILPAQCQPEEGD